MASDPHLDAAAIESLLAEGLNAAERAELERHVASCSSCAAQVEQERRAQIATHAGTRRAPRAALPEVGSFVGRFRLLSKLGQGGMGVVFLAHDAQLERKIALKLLTGAGYEAGPGAQARMMREAQAMARLNHANVVTIYEVGRHEGMVFLAMELVEGMTLSGWLRERRPWSDVVRVMRAAGEGLVAAHASGVVHRDFKPDNILLSTRGGVFVSDFGLARGIGEESDALFSGAPPPQAVLMSPITQAGMLVGTPGYMAPEQTQGVSLDERSDQFSFCLVLYEAVYGMRPAGSPRDEGFAAQPERADVPPWLRDAIARGLRLDRDARFPTMRALLDALTPPRQRPRRAPWLVLGALVLAVGALAVGKLRHRTTPSVCDAPERSLDGVWDAPRKQKIEAAFSASGISDPSGRARYVEEGLDAYSGRLVNAYRDACDATRVRHTQSEIARELRIECLDQRRDRLDVIADVLAAGNKATLEVSSAIQELTDYELACADATVLALIPTPAPRLQRQVRELRQRFVRTQIEELMSSSAAAADYKVLIADIERVGYRPLLAEVWAMLARVNSRKGSYEEALACNRKAIDIADETHQDINGAVYASSALALASYLGRPVAELDTFVEAARSRLVRANDSPIARMAFEDALAVMYGTTGRWAQAVEHRQLAIARSAEIHAPRRSVALRLNNLAAEYEGVGRYDDMLRIQHEAFALLSSIPNAPNDGMLWMMRENLVWGLAGQGRNAEARPIAEEVVHLADQYGELSYSATTEAFLANLLIAAGEKDAGANMAARALASLKKLKLEDSPDSLEMYHQLALAYDALGRTHDAQAIVRTLYEKARPKLAADSDAWVPFLMVGGIVAVHANDMQAARFDLERALALSTKHPFYAGWIAEMRFRLAQALWSTPADRERARGLATRALTELATLPTRAKLAAEVSAWRAMHR